MNWAQLPISQEQFLARQKELQAEAFKHCKPLPGVENLLKRLETAHTKLPSGGSSPAGGGKKVRMALATSSHGRNYEIKTRYMKEMFEVFPDSQKVVGDDERIPKGRGKPLPDIYLLALKCINEMVRSEGEGERDVRPEECLVFEDSVPGCEAGRRAGMRVVWVPDPGLLGVYKGREEEVLAGRTGEHKEDEMDHTEGEPLKGSPGQVGEIEDGWGERLATLEDFDYKKYGIEFGDRRYRSESGQTAVDGTTDKELEEMTARTDGKIHSPQEGSPTPVKSPVPGILESKV